MNKKISTKRVVTISFLVDLLDIFSNLIAAILTGSAVIFAELVQGVADSVGSYLLVVGHRQARRPSDEKHPFGHSREIFFWALLSSIVMLFLGSGFSILRGYQQFISPNFIEHKWIALGALSLSIFTNGYAFFQSYRKIMIPHLSFVKIFKRSTNQLVKTALLRNGLGTLSALVGLVSIFLYDIYGFVLFDAIGAVLVGVLIAVFAVILITQAKYLITGETAPSEVIAKIKKAVVNISEVVSINKIAAVYIGSEQILVDVDIDLKERLTTSEIEQVFDKIQSVVTKQVPEVQKVRIDLNSP